MGDGEKMGAGAGAGRAGGREGWDSAGSGRKVFGWIEWGDVRRTMKSQGGHLHFYSLHLGKVGVMD